MFVGSTCRRCSWSADDVQAQSTPGSLGGGSYRSTPPAAQLRDCVAVSQRCDQCSQVGIRRGLGGFCGLSWPVRCRLCHGADCPCGLGRPATEAPACAGVSAHHDRSGIFCERDLASLHASRRNVTAVTSSIISIIDALMAATFLSVAATSYGCHIEDQ